MKKDSQIRLIAGLCAAILLVSLLLFGGPYHVFGVGLIASIIVYREYTRFFDFTLWEKIFSGIFLIGAYIFHNPDLLKTGACFWIFAVLSFLLATRNAWGPHAQTQALELWTRFQQIFWGLSYTFLLFAFIPLLFERPGGRYLLLLCFMTVSLCDTMAYVFGRKMGKTKLIPSISPGKTVEGSIGGLVGALIAGLFYFYFLQNQEGAIQFSAIKLSFLVLGAALLGQWGDLLESLIKRSCGKKDSGTLMPGHGGLLDRVDSLVFVIPYVYFFFS